MKKKYGLLLLGIVMLLLSSCGKSEVKEPTSGKFYECQKGFMDGLGNMMYETPEGYYFIMGNYLMFVDQRLQKPVVVCDKAECLHHKEHPEKKINCNALFYGATALSYYNGKIYILAENLNAGSKKVVYSIYEVSPNGSERKEFYTSKRNIGSFCIHRGNVYVFEKEFMDEEKNVSENPIITISRFPVENPKKTELLYQSEEYGDGTVNYMTCYQDYCYFLITTAPSGIKINLKTGKVSDFPEGLLYFGIGKDRVYALKTIDIDSENKICTSAYYECGLDGEIKKELTAEEFPVLEKGVLSLYADDDYVYFSDADYGGNEVPEENRKMYVCTYDGEVVCEVLFPGRTTVWGNERYLFYTGWDAESQVIYYVDKSQFGQGAKFEVMFHTSDEDYAGSVWLTQ